MTHRTAQSRLRWKPALPDRRAALPAVRNHCSASFSNCCRDAAACDADCATAIFRISNSSAIASANQKADYARPPARQPRRFPNGCIPACYLPTMRMPRGFPAGSTILRERPIETISRMVSDRGILCAISPGASITHPSRHLPRRSGERNSHPDASASTRFAATALIESQPANHRRENPGYDFDASAGKKLAE